MAVNVEPAVIPHLVVGDASAAIDFYVKAFGAEELGRVPGPDGRLVNAAVRINGFNVMLNDDFPETCGGKSMTPTSLGGTPVTITQEVYPGTSGQDSRLNPTSFEPEGSVTSFDYSYALTNDFENSDIAAPRRHGRQSRHRPSGPHLYAQGAGGGRKRVGECL